MAIDTLIKTTYSDAFRDEMWEDLAAGKLLNPEFKKNIQIGDEVNVQFDDLVTMSDYTGGDLDPANAEYAGTSTVKVKINKGKSVFFKLDDAKIRQIETASETERVKLAKKYGADGREQFARAINAACCQQYVRAGHIIQGSNGAALTVSDSNISKIFGQASVELQKGDDKGHTGWSEGSMLAIVSPQLHGWMSTMGILQYSDVLAKNYKTGYKGNFMGFDVIVDQNIAKDSSGNEYPLFGRSKRTIAGGIQDEFTLESGKKVGGFDMHYWGKGVFGVKAPLSYLLCTAKLSVGKLV